MRIEEIQTNPKQGSDPTMMTFSGRRLEMCMKVKNYSVSELHLAIAKKCEGTKLRPSSAMLYAWINGKGSPQFEYIPILLDVLGVEFNDLCEWRAA